MNRVALAAGEIEYEWVGEAHDTAPGTLVFLHEGLGSVAMWGKFPRVLAAAVGRRALVYSRFGYGGSAPLPRPRSERFLHDEALRVLPELLDRLDVRAPVLVGQSDGASIALIYASAHPVSLSGLILESPHVFAERLTLDAVGSIRARFQEDAAFRQKFGRYHADAARVVEEWTTAWLAPAFRSWNIADGLATLTCPVLLVQAERDPYGSLEHLDRIERAVGGPVWRVVVPGNGHAPHRDCRARVLREMTRFITALVIT